MHTTETLAADLARLGVIPGGVLVVHSGFRALGAVAGGPGAVAAALVRAVGPGTLLAPTFTSNLIDPRSWPVPPPPPEREQILATMPVFDPATSPPFKMGAIAEALWRWPGVRRSRHPVTSWVAIGPLAAELTDDHDFDDPEGLGGPVGRAYQRDAQVLLLGVDHDANTTIHLAESLLDMPHLRALPDLYPALLADGRREWRPVLKTTKCSDGFVKAGPHLAPACRGGQVGDAAALLVRSRDVVRIACGLLSREPAALLCDDPECVHCPASRAALASWRPAQVGPAGDWCG